MKSILTLLFGLAAAFSVTAQKVENDDMYFTSKDRVKLNASTTDARVKVNRTGETREAKPSTAVAESEVAINPTDSYSARTVNPEYSTTNTDKSSKTSADYFVENYTPTGVNSNLKGDYSSSTNTTGYNNPYNTGYSPYSGYGNMGLGNPYMNMGMAGYPYYGSSMSLTYGTPYSPWGYNPWVYGGMAYGYGSVWSNPWAMYDPFYDPFYTVGGSCFSYYGYNNYGYGGAYYGNPGSVIIIDNDGINGRNVAYQKRVDRTSSRMQADGTGGDGLTRGRVSASNSEPYYQRDWRSNVSSTNDGSNSSRTQWYNSDNAGTGTNWGGNSSRSTFWDNGGTTNNGAAFQSQTRSSWSPSDGGSRSSGSSGGSTGSSGGRSRGRD